MSARRLAAILALTFASGPAAAQGYDIDCKLILCLAGGFPSGCADAKAYMIDRITSVPPKPPIGFCAMSDGAEYADYRLDHAWVSPASAEGWVCPPDKLKYFRASREEHGETHVHVFCYDERVVLRAGGRDEAPTYAWLGRTVPERSDFRIAITISPGAEDSYDSGVQRVETGIGRWYGNVYASH